jgi:hypothetical protein
MSISRRTDLSAWLHRFLGRYAAPRHMDEQARRDETMLMLRALDRRAPSVGLDAWLTDLEDILAADLRTRAWPTVGELVAACKKARRPAVAIPVELTDGPPPQERAYRAQLRDWVAGKRHIGVDVVTRERLMAIGVSPEEADDMVDQARRGHGILPTSANDPGCPCEPCRRRRVA